MDESAMVRVAQRMKARLSGVADLTFERVEAGDLWLRFDVNGKPYSLGPRGETEEEVMSSLVELARVAELEVFPEIVLTGPTALVLDGHQLRVAELGRAYDVRVRERVDPDAEYTAAEADEDVNRLALLIASYERTAATPADDGAAIVRKARKDAALLLSRFHGWKRGAPASSPGYNHVRDVFDGKRSPCPRDTDGDGNCGQPACTFCGSPR